MDADHYRLRDFLTRTAQPYEWHAARSENCFGFPDGIGGAELARLAGRQAERFGAELQLLRGIQGSRMKGHDEPVELILDDGSEITASVVLAATGMDWRRLDLD